LFILILEKIALKVSNIYFRAEEQMAEKEKSFNIIYIPERGSSRSFRITKSLLYLIIIAIFAFSMFIFRFVSSFSFYRAEYVKATSFSVQEKQQIMADEL